MFLFLNSWRSTVITGLTLPIALIGTFLFMYVCGFTINTITLMALSLCVGLLIDDAIVVRENIVRHVQMGKSAHDAALEGTNEIGLAVLATTLSIVAVFLPIGFMGGIDRQVLPRVRHHHRRRGADLDVRQLHARPHALVSVWHDPAAHGHAAAPPVTLYDKTIGRVTGVFESATDAVALRTATRRILGVERCSTAKKTLMIAAASTLVASVLHHPAAGRRVRAQGRLFSETQ